MNNIVAINQVSADRVHELQEQTIKEEMRGFIQNDPEARQIMLEVLKEKVGKMSLFDVTYHMAFKEVTEDILKSPEITEILSAAVMRALNSEKEYDYRIMEAIGQTIAGQLKLELVK